MYSGVQHTVPLATEPRAHFEDKLTPSRQRPLSVCTRPDMGLRQPVMAASHQSNTLVQPVAGCVLTWACDVTSMIPSMASGWQQCGPDAYDVHHRARSAELGKKRTCRCKTELPWAGR